MQIFETKTLTTNWDSLSSDPFPFGHNLNTQMNSSSKMDDSDDGRKRKNNLNEWTNNPFERVNHSTNFEDYACSSDDTNFLYGSSEDTKTNSNQTSIKNLYSFPKPINPSIVPIITSQKDGSSLFVESCLSANNSSTEVTPSGTPQSSPYSIRKGKDINQKKLSSNPKLWFYSNLFSSDVKTIKDKSIPQIPKNGSFKNLCVSNFDINAVGPTSW